MFDRKNDFYAEVISVDWERVVFAFDTCRPGFVSIECEPGNISVKSVEAADTGRLELTGLLPGTLYNGVFRWEGGEKTFQFETLPAPSGEMLGQFALIADPHVSTKTENRKGRYFVESAAIAADCIRLCQQMGCDTTLWPGDLTNAGTPEEYELFAGVVKLMNIVPLVVPGNHDHAYKEPGNSCYTRVFGKKEWSVELPGAGVVIGIDTGAKILTPEGAALLRAGLDKYGKVMVITHYQLYPAPHISHGPGPLGHVISNTDEYRDLLDELSASGSVIYAGHQNITTITRIGNSIQVNLPQPVQFPCGFIRVRVYENGLYHTFVPISSEVWRQWSRRASEEAADYYGEPQWHCDYRCGSGVKESNFFHPFTRKGN